MAQSRPTSEGEYPSAAPYLRIENAVYIPNSDKLHNLNCYEYLKNIYDVFVRSENVQRLLAVLPALQELSDLFVPAIAYNGCVAYGDKYHAILSNLQKDVLLALPEHKALADFKQLMHVIFHNHNYVLERSFAMVSSSINGRRDTGSEARSRITSRLQGQGQGQGASSLTGLMKIFSRGDINKTDPVKEGSMMGRISTFVGAQVGNFDALTATNIPNLPRKTWPARANHPFPLEYRFGTQGQIYDSVSRVNPLFMEFLRQLPRKEDNKKDNISHVYFNKLGFDGNDIERQFERSLSDALHRIETEMSHVAVITLPADKGFFDVHHLEQHAHTEPYKVIYNKFYDIACGQSHEPIKDFYISDRIKAKLYGSGEPYDQDAEKEIITTLLTRSFKTLGFEPHKLLSPAEYTGVYFYFINYELTNFILNKLNPDSFNFSCKDAIDRGRVASLAFNLFESIAQGHAMTEDEFKLGLQAAATAVKGRGVNHHVNFLWKAVDLYLMNNGNKCPVWLTMWRDLNALQSITHYIAKLEAYRKERDSKPTYTGYTGGFLGAMTGAVDKNSKLAGIDKLLEILRALDNPIEGKVIARCTEAEWKAVNDGRVGDIVKEMIAKGMLPLENYAPNRAPSPEKTLASAAEAPKVLTMSR